jgi:hypothetical protein
MPHARYLTVAEVRAEGYPFSDTTTYNDAYVESKIDIASEQIEHFTGNWFASLSRTLSLDGDRGHILKVPAPIVQIDTITIVTASRYGVSSTYNVDLTEVQVYNRHLTKGLLSPDDRKNPGIAIESLLAEPVESLDFWPEGDQNIQIEGKFGWTELAHDVTPAETATGSQIPADEGVTPFLIKRACMLLVRRHFPKAGDYQALLSTGAVSNVRRFQARDQSVTFGSGGGGFGGGGPSMNFVGGSTGDDEVNRILLGFRRIPEMGWA